MIIFKNHIKNIDKEILIGKMKRLAYWEVQFARDQSVTENNSIKDTRIGALCDIH
ncbi:hypothetical protein VITU9109_18645 [Vibrio tubiashii ATCC 19109]|uniref:Uncharacterized protein n=1 Tax=Vibrio tubiashii ATCC 19109 TaxID=1051646 RepID=A0ABP2LRM3_9VIBR|nr:hypothetical protein VITU9109_18645 [Vibrio tubiashii ATCC 19109]